MPLAVIDLEGAALTAGDRAFPMPLTPWSAA